MICMDLTLLAIIGVLVVVAVSALSPRLGIAAPLLLVAVGVGLTFVPGVPRVEIEPEIILAGVLPPLLYAAAVNMPAVDFRRDLKSIGGLSIIVVIVSAVLCGLAFERIIPGIGLAEGIALGAVLSPTDAVATSIVKRTGVAPRLVTVLEGESMINDASALVLLRSAIAATSGTVALGSVALDFVLAIVIAAAVGAVVAAVSMLVRAQLRDATLNTAISFVVPFVSYIPAEQLGASGLVAVVTTGLCTGYWGVRELRPQDRLAEAVNWRTIAFLLEGGVFLFMGLEVRPLVDDFRADGGEWGVLALATSAGIGILLVIRTIYVALLVHDQRQDRGQRERMAPRIESIRDYLASPEGQKLSKRRVERIHSMVVRRKADLEFYEKEKLGRRDGVVLVWAGMRGSITLAAAQTLPADTDQRGLLILVAFSVAVTTLAMQGGSLAWVVRRLGAESDRAELRRDELASLSRLLTDVANSRIDEAAAEGHAAPAVVAEARAQSVPDKLTRWAGPAGEEREQRLEEYRVLRRAVLADQREALLEARATGRYDSAALGEMLRRVDSGELSVEAIE